MQETTTFPPSQVKEWRDRVAQRRKDLFGGRVVSVKPRVIGTPRSRLHKKLVDEGLLAE